MKTTFKKSYGLYLLLALALGSCGDCNTDIKEKETGIKYIDLEDEITVYKIDRNNSYSIITIDGCEYIYHTFYRSGHESWYQYALVHKGNCKYCIERNQK